MRSRKVLVSPAVVALALSVVALTSAGCGGSSKGAATTASTGSTLPPGVKPAVHIPPPKSAVFTANLVPYPEGSPVGSARAVVSIRAPTLEICWTISQLLEVPNPTELRLFHNYTGAPGANGLHLGSRYAPSGCARESAEVLGVIVAKPEKFVLSIHSANHPHGAIRGPLEP